MWFQRLFFILVLYINGLPVITGQTPWHSILPNTNLRFPDQPKWLDYATKVRFPGLKFNQPVQLVFQKSFATGFLENVIFARKFERHPRDVFPRESGGRSCTRNVTQPQIYVRPKPEKNEDTPTVCRVAKTPFRYTTHNPSKPKNHFTRFSAICTSLID